MKNVKLFSRAAVAAAIVGVSALANVGAAHADPTDPTRIPCDSPTQTHSYGAFQSDSPKYFSHMGVNAGGSPVKVYVQYRALSYEKVVTTSYSGQFCQIKNVATNFYGWAAYVRYTDPVIPGGFAWLGWQQDNPPYQHTVADVCEGYDSAPASIHWMQWNCPMR